MKKYNYEDAVLKEIPEPEKDCTLIPVDISDKTIEQRKQKIIEKMNQRKIDVLLIYADLEHGNNFEYLVGFLPRFEEALLVFHKDQKAYLVMGNENLNKVSKARLQCKAIHAPYFSLPNQPMNNTKSFKDIMKETDIENKRIGVVGWKNFTSLYEDNRQLYDIPVFIMDVLIELCGKENITNQTDIFIGENGVRTINEPDEIAHYEFGASLASDCMLDALNALQEGVTEMKIGDILSRYGQRNSVVTIAAFGQRFIRGNMYPTQRELQLKDTVSLTVGYKGGLSSRAGYAVHSSSELDEDVQDYMHKVCAPYFIAIAAWLENIHVGMTGKEMYDLINDVLPQEKYHWTLCPGHLTADEEWLSSPIYENSHELIQSGMLLQSDIIPSVEGYGGVSAESTICIADIKLREKIKEQYPEMYQRMMKRRKYIIENLGIQLHEDVLPMCSTLAYMRPFMLSKQAIIINHE